ncbi:MAG: hypothetical protein ACI84D_003540 [Thalassolituus oleivorans]|jgi:hypothetical protein
MEELKVAPFGTGHQRSNVIDEAKSKFLSVNLFFAMVRRSTAHRRSIEWRLEDRALRFGAKLQQVL